eukprot:7640099-Heterocapsa_arctica.AAC.1
MVPVNHGDSWPPGVSGSPLLHHFPRCAGLRGRDAGPASNRGTDAGLRDHAHAGPCSSIRWAPAYFRGR